MAPSSFFTPARARAEGLHLNQQLSTKVPYKGPSHLPEGERR